MKKLKKKTAALKLKEMRKKKNITQSDMASACGISPTYYNFLENKKKKMSSKMLARLNSGGKKIFGRAWSPEALT